MRENRVVCPKCGQFDAVRKVSSIVSEGTTRTENAALGMGHTREGIAFFDAYSQSFSRTNLASALARPPRPHEPPGQGCVRLFLFTRVGCTMVILATIATGGVCSFPFLYSTYRANPIRFLIPFVVFIVIGIVLLCWIILSLRRESRAAAENQANFPEALQQWERSVRRWEELYYCYRDDGVFLPLQSRLVPQNDMQAFLFASDKHKRQT